MSNQAEAGIAGTGLDWELLYETYAPMVRRHAAKLVESSHVDDIVQETFLRAYRNRDSIRPGRPLGPWLTVIARRTAIDVVRRQHVRDRMSNELPRPLPAAEPTEDEYFNAVRRDAVGHAFAQLSERHRRVLAAAVLGAEQGGEARALDEATRSVLTRARRAFRRRYIDLSRESGVFGGVITTMRWRSASLRDTLVRAEAWLQTGTAFIVACAGLSLLGTPASTANATSVGFLAPITDAGEPDVSPHASSGRINVPPPPNHGDVPDKDPASAPTPRGSSSSSPSTAKTSVDWYAGSNGTTAGIDLYVLITTPDGKTYDSTTHRVDCHANPVAQAECAAWDLIPESRRRMEADGDNTGTPPEFSR